MCLCVCVCAYTQRVLMHVHVPTSVCVFVQVYVNLWGGLRATDCDRTGQTPTVAIVDWQRPDVDTPNEHSYTLSRHRQRSPDQSSSSSSPVCCKTVFATELSPTPIRFSRFGARLSHLRCDLRQIVALESIGLLPNCLPVGFAPFAYR